MKKFVGLADQPLEAVAATCAFSSGVFQLLEGSPGSVAETVGQSVPLLAVIWNLFLVIGGALILGTLYTRTEEDPLKNVVFMKSGLLLTGCGFLIYAICLGFTSGTGAWLATLLNALIAVGLFARIRIETRHAATVAALTAH